MHVDRVADPSEEGDRQLAAQVLAELLEASHHGIGIGQEFVRRRQTNLTQHVDHAVRDTLVQQASACRIRRIHGHTDRHGLAMRQLAVGHAFEPVRQPVAEIERPRAPRLERVATERDVPPVQLRAPRDDGHCRGHVARADRRGIPLDPHEQLVIAQQGDLHRLAESTAPRPVGRCREQVLVAHHRVRHRKGADEVLLAPEVHAVLDGHPRIVLPQRGGRHAHQPHAAMGDRRTEADGIQHRTAADRQHEALSIDAVLVHGLDHAVDHRHRALGLFAAGNRLHQADGRHRRMHSDVGTDLLDDARVRRQHV